YGTKEVDEDMDFLTEEEVSEQEESDFDCDPIGPHIEIKDEVDEWLNAEITKLMIEQKVKRKVDAIVMICRNIIQETKEEIKKKKLKTTDDTQHEETSSVTSNDTNHVTMVCPLHNQLNPSSNWDSRPYNENDTYPTLNHVEPPEEDRPIRPWPCNYSFEEWLEIRVGHNNLQKADRELIFNEWILESYDVNDEYAKEIGNPYSRRFDEYKRVFKKEIEHLSNEYILRIGRSFICVTNREDDTLSLGRVNGARFKAMIQKEFEGCKFQQLEGTHRDPFNP
ncbi:hypothetical protein Tco_1349583, partial [Tanacetum coccineum]